MMRYFRLARKTDEDVGVVLRRVSLERGDGAALGKELRTRPHGEFAPASPDRARVDHLGRDGESPDPANPSRAPPQADLLI